MTSAPPGGCQAGRRCGEPACFRGQAVETSGSNPARKDLLACATHLGALVVALTAWVQEQQLTEAELTVLAIDSAAPPAARPATAAAEPEGFAFITLSTSGDSQR